MYSDDLSYDFLNIRQLCMSYKATPFCMYLKLAILHISYTARAFLWWMQCTVLLVFLQAD